MFQEDYLLRQINQLARALGKLVFDFIGIKNTGLIEEYHQVADKILKEEIDYNLTELLDIPDDEFMSHLLRKDGFNDTNLNLLADLFYEMGSYLPKKEALTYLKKAFILYQYVENHDSTYSFERRKKIEDTILKMNNEKLKGLKSKV